MNLVVDASAVIAVIANEACKAAIVRQTQGADLIAPPSLHWEIGNAFSAMFKRRRLTIQDARKALHAYRQIPIRFSDVELEDAVELSAELDVHAYDAYLIVCALRHQCKLLTLDTGLAEAAAKAGVSVVEIGS